MKYSATMLQIKRNTKTIDHIPYESADEQDELEYWISEAVMDKDCWLCFGLFGFFVAMVFILGGVFA